MAALKLDPSKKNKEQHCNVEIDVQGRSKCTLPPINPSLVVIPGITVTMAVGVAGSRLVRVTYPTINVRRCEGGGVRHLVKYPDFTMSEEGIHAKGTTLSFMEELPVPKSVYRLPPRQHEFTVKKYLKVMDDHYAAYDMQEDASFVPSEQPPSPSPTPDPCSRPSRQATRSSCPDSCPTPRPATRSSSNRTNPHLKPRRQKPYERR